MEAAMAHSTLPVPAHPEFPQAFPELELLNLVGVVQHAIGNLNLNDSAAARRTLMTGYEKYVNASGKENHNGNRTAAA
jgi:hypothetical protein